MTDPIQPDDHPVDPPAPNGPEKAPVDGTDAPAHTPILEMSDRMTILGLAAMLITIASLFYLFVGWQGLLTYAPLEPVTEAGNQVEPGYFASALDYRERRLALALTYRTFVTTLGFTVGLVLCAIGGIFVLRRATAWTTLSAGSDAPPNPGGDNLRMSLVTTSPGIVFLLAGTGVMFFTQFWALPVGAPEIFPANANLTCPSEQREAGSCITRNGDGSQQDPVLEYCRLTPTASECQSLTALRERLEILQ